MRPQSSEEPRATLFKGAYKRSNTTSQFLPCGASEPLEVRGGGEAMRALRERWRWLSVQFERPLYLVAGGAIVTDTIAGTGVATDSAAPRLARRFLLMRVDTVRAWGDGDCGLSRAPRW